MSGSIPIRTSPDLTCASWLGAEESSFDSDEESVASPALPTGETELASPWLDDEELSFESPPSSPQKTARKAVSAQRRVFEEYFSDEEKDISAPSTPQKKPLKRAELLTPEKVRGIKRKFSEFDPNAEVLTSTEKKDFEEGLASLKEVSDSPKRKKRSTEARNLHNMFVEKTTKGTQGVVEKHGQLRDSLRTNPFFGMFLGKLNEIDASCQFPAEDLPKPLRPVNYQHIVEPIVYTTVETKETKSLGWHFCTPEHFPMLKDRIESISGVFSATYQVPGAAKHKRSSFFPLVVTTVDMLDGYIQTSELISKNENRMLYRIPALEIHFEAIAKHGCLHSAYPLLYVGTWEENECFPIFAENKAFSSQEILHAARALMVQYAHREPVSSLSNPIRYYSEDGSKIYVELAPELAGEFGILQGILFIFDRTLFAELENQFDPMLVDSDQ